MNDFQVFLSLTNYFLFLYSSRSFLVTLQHIFLGIYFFWKLPPPLLNFRHLLGLELSSILSSSPNCSNLLFCKYSLIFFSCSLFQLLSSRLILHYHLTICGFLSSLISFCPLSSQVLVLYSTTLHTEAKYNLPFPCTSKPLLGNKGKQMSQLTISISYSCLNTVNYTPLVPIALQRCVSL